MILVELVSSFGVVLVEIGVELQYAGFDSAIIDSARIDSARSWIGQKLDRTKVGSGQSWIGLKLGQTLVELNWVREVGFCKQIRMMK